MFEDDDFFISDDELAEDNNLTIVDTARVKVLDSLIKAAQDMKENLKFNEKSEASSNTQIIASYVDSLISLEQLDASGLSDEETNDIIDKIFRSTTELTFNNINDVLPDEEESQMPQSDSSEDDEGTDW